jgi:hypothetical protein
MAMTLLTEDRPHQSGSSPAWRGSGGRDPSRDGVAPPCHALNYGPRPIDGRWPWSKRGRSPVAAGAMLDTSEYRTITPGGT